jgi:hypothetical protein
LTAQKIKSDIHSGYKALEQDSIITLTANHITIAYRCEKTPKPNQKKKKSEGKK